MNILGISGGTKAGNQDGAAALLIDGNLVAAAEEERFTGTKFANGLLPKSVVSYCLKAAGLRIEDIDDVVFAGATYRDFDDVLRRYFQYHFGYAPPITRVDHHEAHAACAFFGSGWDEALVITMDFSGDGKSTTIRQARGERFDLLEEYEKPNSLGFYYSSVTQYLGFQKDSDEYKVMGMAAYGTPRFDMSPVLELTQTGYTFDASFLRGISPGRPAPSKQERLFDVFPLPEPARVPGSPILPVHYDIAASAQRQLELAVLQMVRHYVRRTGVARICLAGGVALNCKMNQHVREDELVSEIYVPPVCSDAGLALGAAYLLAVQKGAKAGPLRHAYWGPEFSPDEIRSTIELARVPFRETTDPVREAIQRVAAGQIVGWFQGRMEYGPRALGNRSILADPRQAAMKDCINQRIKFREEFRPIAPAVLGDRGSEYFARYTDSPFMTQNFRALAATARLVPAVVHVDGTCRLQSVHEDSNPLFYDLISRLAAETGVPMIVNTSLNAYDDPMVCAPYQALRTFYTTGLDALFMGPFLLEK